MAAYRYPRLHRRTLVLPVLLAVLAWVMVGCGSGSSPVARDAAGCPAVAGAPIRSAPPSAGDPATGTWLGQLDRLRDLARTLRDPVSQQLAAELDYAGARVALDGFPPQLAIVPAQETCTISDLSSQSAPASVIPASREWLRANPPPARPGMTAGIITRADFGWGECPAAGHGSQVAAGGGCEAWSLTLITTAGTFHASCGDITSYMPCTSATARPGSQQYFPGIGDELYVPDNGQVTGAADITIISRPPWPAFSAQAAGAR
jgi:hypothetical protein